MVDVREALGGALPALAWEVVTGTFNAGALLRPLPPTPPWLAGGEQVSQVLLEELRRGSPRALDYIDALASSLATSARAANRARGRLWSAARRACDPAAGLPDPFTLEKLAWQTIPCVAFRLWAQAGERPVPEWVLEGARAGGVGATAALGRELRRMPPTARALLLVDELARSSSPDGSTDTRAWQKLRAALPDVTQATWIASGVVEWVDRAAGAITLWMEGWPGPETTPVVAVMPRWFLYSAVSFSVPIPRRCQREHTLADVVWGQFSGSGMDIESDEEVY